MKKRLGFLAAGAALGLAFAGALVADRALGQVGTPGVPVVALGYCQLTSIDAGAALSACSGGIPAGANAAWISAEAQAVRWRDDGTAPTASVGMTLAVGAPFFYAGALSKVQVISQVAGAKLNVLFYQARVN